MIKNKKGQVAVILILVIAVVLIFYAISLNFGRLSHLKTITTIASNTGTSLLASEMASYGQKIAVEKISGDHGRCKSSGVFRAIIIGITAIVLAYFTAGWSLTLLYTVILAVALVAVQATVIEPGLTASWNTIMAKVMTPQDMFIERGIQTALQRAVTDTVQVADLNDADEDGVFGLDAADVPKDRIGRYGFYYYENRLKKVLPKNTGPIEEFLCGLDNFLHEQPIRAVGCADTDPPGGGWGLYDPINNIMPVGSTGGCATAECDWCCLPDVDLTYGEEEVIRPPECGQTNAFWEAECGNRSPYDANYPWVYDSYYENRGIGPDFDSFREQIGRDDEHTDYYKNPNDPNEIPQTLHLPGDEGFHLNDTTNFYIPPYYTPATPENREGIFPFFYKASDWALDLTRRNPGNREHCYWSDYNPPNNDPDCLVGPLSAELADLPLVLPIDPNPPFSPLTYNTNPFVDDIFDNTPGNPPLAPDKVAISSNILASSGVCAQNALTDVTVDGFWKRGGDRFCSGDWPYAEHCPKHGAGCTLGSDSVDCMCGQAGALPADNWPDDVLDDLVYHMPAFIQWAEELLWRDPMDVAREFKVWYQEAAQWIEPGTAIDPVGSGAAVGDTSQSRYCFEKTCKPEDGWLHRWWKQIIMMISRLEALRTGPYTGIDTDGGGPITACNQVWCVPPAGCLPGVIQPGEIDTFGSGNIANVIACLNWNANNPITDGVTIATGNAEKFQACDNACRAPDYTAANYFCANLPRSLVPNFFSSLAFDAVDIPRVTTLEACPATCTTCFNNCDAQPDPPCDAACKALCKSACSCAEFICESPTFVPDVANALRVAKGSCVDINGNPGGPFLDSVAQSGLEAENQVAKFRQRLAFLQNRSNELDRTLYILSEAEGKFNDFLSCDIDLLTLEPKGPACKLIKDRINYKYQPSGLPYEAVYGWQTEAEDLTLRWHIVKVEARIPGKCDDACNLDQDPGDLDPAWPWIETWTEGFMDTTRCYEMRSTEGIVKTRVTRFDERRDSSMLSFANGVPIWQFKYDHPERPVDYTQSYADGNIYNPGGLEASCGGSMINQFPPGTPLPYPFYQGAFILNKPGDNPGCWTRVHDILTRGVTSETCAQYYWQGGMRHGMNFKFVPCKEF